MIILCCSSLISESGRFVFIVVLEGNCRVVDQMRRFGSDYVFIKLGEKYGVRKCCRNGGYVFFEVNVGEFLFFF